MVTYVSLTNELLRRLNEVPLDIAGDGFDTVRNVQALAKDSVNSSIRLILQDGREWHFLKKTYTQTLSAGTRTYSFPTDTSTVDWDSFYLKKTSGIGNTPRKLGTLTFEDYTQNYRVTDDNDTGSGLSAPTSAYQTLEEKFGVTPVPNNSYEVDYVYWSFPSDMLVYNDECAIPERFKHVILDGAMMIMMRFISNDQSASVHQNNFEQGIKTMRRLTTDDELYLRSTVIRGRG